MPSIFQVKEVRGLGVGIASVVRKSPDDLLDTQAGEVRVF